MSIKNKLVTAITTAGLLAGLFGSAFVPTASARVNNAFDKPAPGQTTIKSVSGDWENTIDGYERGKTFGVLEYSEDSEVLATGDNDYSIGYRLRMSDGTHVDRADLTATSSNPAVVRVAWAYSGDDADAPLDAGCEAADLDSAFAGTDSLENIGGVNGFLADEADDGGDKANFYALCIRFVSASKSGTAVVSVTANGIKLPNVTVVSLGDLDSLTLTNNFSYNVISANNAGTGRTFTVVGKDVAGQVINGPNGTLADFDLESWTGNTFEELGTDAGTLPVNANGNDRQWIRDYVDNEPSLSAASKSKYSYNQIQMSRHVCVTGDEGKTFNLGVELENDNEDIVESNAITMTCSGDQSEFTVKSVSLEYESNGTTTGAADWAKSTVGDDDLDGVIGIYATVVDADGKPMGLGAHLEHNYTGRDATLGFSFEIDGQDDLNIGYGPAVVGVGGKVMLGYIVPDITGAVGTIRPIDITISDWDANYDGTASLADLEIRKSYKVGSSTAKTYLPTKSWSKAHTRVVFTVAWGIECSNAVVEFDIEKANGDMIAAPLRRRADANGVARLTLEKRRTYNYVYAISCDALGNLELDPVRAKFK